MAKDRKEKKTAARTYTGPPYKTGLILNIKGLSNKPMDLKAWPTPRVEKMIAKYPGLEKYFSKPA